MGVRQPPEVEPGMLDWTILERSYNLIEHIQQLKKSINKQEIQHFVNLVEADVAAMRDTLHVVKSEIKDIKGKQPVSHKTNIEQQQPEQP